MPSSPPPCPARLLWDQGGLWSLMALEACESLNLPNAPITAAEIAAGGLAGARLLMVPGGWPALKAAALGSRGRVAVRDFVSGGGIYLGLCGGAGLALAEEPGLALVNLGRERGAGRLPSASGPLRVEPGPEAGSHPFWGSVAAPATFHVWWPGQFAPLPVGMQVVAVYQGPAPGLHSADLEVEQVPAGDWPRLEKTYGLRLDPAALWGQPAVVQAGFGRGTAFLSYLHLDTPGCPAGATALAGLLRGWLGEKAFAATAPPSLVVEPSPAAQGLAQCAQELWDLGRSLGLWRPRHPAMPWWRRGGRGLELWSFLALSQAVARRWVDRPAAARRLAGLAEPAAALYEQGPRVLAAQARRLEAGGGPPAPEEARWFPAPRRVGGSLAATLDGLEELLLELVRALPARD